MNSSKSIQLINNKYTMVKFVTIVSMVKIVTIVSMVTHCANYEVQTNLPGIHVTLIQ